MHFQYGESFDEHENDEFDEWNEYYRGLTFVSDFGVFAFLTFDNGTEFKLQFNSTLKTSVNCIR